MGGGRVSKDELRTNAAVLLELVVAGVVYYAGVYVLAWSSRLSGELFVVNFMFGLIVLFSSILIGAWAISVSKWAERKGSHDTIGVTLQRDSFVSC